MTLHKRGGVALMCSPTEPIGSIQKLVRYKALSDNLNRLRSGGEVQKGLAIGTLGNSHCD